MKRFVKIVVIFIVLSVGIASCKSSCGCKGGYGEGFKTGNQVEQCV